jgi:hypothetical protein
MKLKTVRIGGIIFGLFAIGAFGAIALQSPTAAPPALEKICPITFELYPGTLLEANYAAKIERDNAKLSTFLGEMRSAGTIKSGIKSWLDKARRVQTDAAAMEGEVKALYSLFKERGLPNPFVGTYLADPSLTTESGETVTGMAAVLGELLRIIDNSTYISAQSVHVYLEYLPSNSQAFKEINAKYPPARPELGPIDIIAHIKTVLAYAPKDAPVTIEGKEPHRTICDPGY